MDCARTCPNLNKSDLDGIRVPPRYVTNSDVREGSNVVVDRRYAGVRYHSPAVVLSILLARGGARGRARCDGGCDWDNADTVD